VKTLHFLKRKLLNFRTLISFINRLLVTRRMVTIKGHDFVKIMVSDSYNRRSLQYRNRILDDLKRFNLTEDDIDIPMEMVAMRKAQASVTWYMWHQHLFFSYNSSAKFVDNLAMVAQVLEHFLNLLGTGKMSQEKFIELFKEDHDILKQRKNARKVLGMEEESTDFEAMHKNYRRLAKEHHPDMPSGSTEKFKEISNAHDILEKELL
jgi:hypothetical protein